MGYKAKHMDGSTYWHASTTGEGLDNCCGGTRSLHCYCGGDQCVCGNFGEVECPGCEDCEGDREDGDYDDWEERQAIEGPEEPARSVSMTGNSGKVLPCMREWAKANGIVR